MKKKIVVWLAIVILISGWLAFVIEMAVSQKELGELKAKNVQMDSQLKSLQVVSQNLNDTISTIDKTIQTFQKIKNDLLETKGQLEKKSKTE